MRRLLALIVVTSSVLPSLAVAAPAGGPMATLKQKNGDVNKLLAQKPEKDSPAEKKQKEDIKGLAATLLDYSDMAKRSMAAHWDPLKPAQRDEFATTFKQMLENNYVKNLRSNLDYQIKYEAEELVGEDATVKTEVKVKTKGKSTDAEVVYKMHKVGDRWLVWDIITDEVSLLRNYKNQFHRIITEQGYDKLLEKMKSKLKETA